jgi:hypothetical protein
MNVELLLQVSEHITQLPNRLHMNSWILDSAGWRTTFESDNGFDQIYYAPCGKACCLGGWAVILGGHPEYHNYDDVEHKALELLQLDEYQGDRLFYVQNWPTRYKNDYNQAKGQYERAQVAAKRIRWFIDTNGSDVLPETIEEQLSRTQME